MKQSLTVNAHAKINLTLDVKGKRPDGYHDVELICQAVELCDIVTVSICEADGFSVRCVSDSPDIPRDSHNIAAKAVEAMAERCGLKCRIFLYIQKRIPHSAGLGGGSSDAAAALRALNELTGAGLSVAELSEIGSGIGADVPFCIHGGAAICRGTGTDVEDLKTVSGLLVLIIKPPISISTAWAYRNLDLKNVVSHPDTAAAAVALERGDVRGLASGMRNILETVSIANYPVIDEIKESLVKNGAVGAMMSGSGPSVFGLFDDDRKLSTAYARLGSLYGRTIATRTITAGDQWGQFK